MILAGHPKRFIVDPRAEHAGDHVFNSFGAMLDFFEAGEVPDGGLTVVCRFGQDQQDFSDLLFEFIRKLKGWAVLVDEVDQFCNPRFIPWHLKALCNYNRQDRQTYVMCSRRGSAVHRDLTALADFIYFFRTTEPNDLKYIRDYCGKETAEKVEVLEPFRYLTYEP